MSIWRAPLLILGILIILLAAGALVAPWLIDFNRYKPQLEHWAERATGRKVRINGDVAFVLFPWPAARLRNVQVEGVEGGGFSHVLKVHEVRARLSLAALFAARWEVERITLVQPELVLTHLGTQGRNRMAAGGRGGGVPLSAESVALDAIHIVDGRVRLADQRLRGELRIANIEALVRAPRMTGPWLLTGTWRMLGHDWKVRLSTGMWEEGKPFSMSLRMEPPTEQAGHMVRLNGELHLKDADGKADTPQFAGDLSITPVLPKGRADPLDPLRLMALKGRLSVTPDVVELGNLRITPQLAAASPFGEVTGKARLELGAVQGASISLSTPKLRLDQRLMRLLGAMDGVPAGQAGKPAGGQRKADGLMLLRRHLLALARRLGSLPPDMLLEVDARAASLLAAGHAFSNVALSAEASSELLAIHHLRADVPGQGEMSFRGSLLGGDLLQLTGELAVRSGDVRALLFAVSPSARRLLADAWRGRSGRLELLATLDLTDYALRLVSRKLKLDGDALTLDWRLHEPERNKVGRESLIRLQARRLDLERLMRGRRGALALMSALRRNLAEGEGGLQLDLAVDALRLAGLSWRGVALSLQRKRGELHLPVLKVADVAGLALRASGDFRQQAAGGWRGQLQADVKGEKAATLWRLAGRFAEVGTMPAWLEKLGAVDIRLRLDMNAGAHAEQHIEATIDGQAGPLRLSLSAVGSGKAGTGKSEGQGPDWQHYTWRLKGDTRSDAAAALLALAGVQASLPEGPARLKLAAEGVPATGMKGSVEVELPAARASAQGTLRLGAADAETAVEAAGDLAPMLAGEGQVTLALDDVAAWSRLAGGALPTAMPLKGKVHVAFSPRRLHVSKMALQAADNSLTGKLTLTWPEAGAISGIEATAPRLTGEVIADRLDVQTVATLLLSEPDNRQRLRRRMAGGRVLDVVLRGRKLMLPWPGVELPDGKILLRQDDEDAETLRVELAAGQAEAALQVDAWLKRAGPAVAVRSVMKAVLPLAQLLRSADGAVRMQGTGELTLQAKGRAATLNGLALALQGDGRLKLQGAVLHGVAPARLLAVVRSIATQAELERFDALARAALLQGAWKLPKNVALRLRLDSGLLEALPQELPMPGEEPGHARLFGLLDMAARKLDVTAEFVAVGENAPPAFSVNLAGQPGALALSTQWGVLRDWVQQQVIRRQEEEVKRLEERQLRLREQAHILEEKARQEELRRQRQERMRQEAARLHERLREVLAGAWQQMQAEERKKKGAGGAGRGRGKPSVGIEALIRQAQEDEASGSAGARAKGKRAALPAAARAMPQAFAAQPPKPKRRPAHKPPGAGNKAGGKKGVGAKGKSAGRTAGGKGRANTGGKNKATSGKNKAGAGPATRPAFAARGGAASGAKAAAKPAGRNAARGARQLSQGTAGRRNGARSRTAARQRVGTPPQGNAPKARRKVGNFNNGSSRAAQARETVRRVLSQPLTNWNRLAP